MTFKNGSPMARPFVRPAWDEMKEKSKETLKGIIAIGLNK